MMRIIFLLLLVVFNLYSQDKAVYIKKGEIAPFDGFLINEEKVNYFKNLEDKNKTLLEIIEEYEKKIINLENLNELNRQKINLLESKISFYEDYVQKINNYSKDFSDIKIYRNMTYIIIGISIAELLGFGCFYLGYYLAGR